VVVNWKHVPRPVSTKRFYTVSNYAYRYNLDFSLGYDIVARGAYGKVLIVKSPVIASVSPVDDQ
jgi:hypothetical protein